MKEALTHGQLDVAISTGIWLEYEEVVTRYAGRTVWQRVVRIFDLAEQLHGNIRHVEPSFEWHLMAADPDDDKFSDCSVAAEADFLITEDGHFDVLQNSGYKPQPITPTAFISDVLGVAR